MSRGARPPRPRWVAERRWPSPAFRRRSRAARPDKGPKGRLSKRRCWTCSWPSPFVACEEVVARGEAELDARVHVLRRPLPRAPDAAHASSEPHQLEERYAAVGQEGLAAVQPCSQPEAVRD